MTPELTVEAEIANQKINTIAQSTEEGSSIAVTNDEESKFKDISGNNYEEEKQIIDHGIY